jgi:hypothetical protein
LRRTALRRLLSISSVLRSAGRDLRLISHGAPWYAAS